jgi:hypothetical protein
MLLTFFAPMLLLHILAYFAVCRHLQIFRQEKVIFLYHLSSFVVVVGIFGIRCCWLPSLNNLFELVFAFAVHGIYSLSTLELWTLAEGGYSLSILMEFETARRNGTERNVNKIASIGDSKKVNRLSGLEKMGLLTQTGDTVTITGLGAKIAGILGLIVWLANVKKEG